MNFVSVFHKNFQLWKMEKGNHDIRERRLFESDLHHQRRS